MPLALIGAMEHQIMTAMDQQISSHMAADETDVDKTIIENFTNDVIDEGDEIITVTLSGAKVVHLCSDATVTQLH